MTPISRYLTRVGLSALAALAVPLALAAILVPFRAHSPTPTRRWPCCSWWWRSPRPATGWPAILAALSAAVWFDFFLTRPYERFDITSRDDIETTVLLLVIGVAVTELAVWGWREHAAASRRAGYLDGIGVTVAGGGRRTTRPSQLTDEVSGQLTRLLALSLPLPVRRRRARPPGRAEAQRLGHGPVRTWDANRDGFPPGRGRGTAGERGPVPGPSSS